VFVVFWVVWRVFLPPHATRCAVCGLSVLVGVLFLLLIEVVFIYGCDLVRFFCGSINVFFVNGMMMTVTMFTYPPYLGHSISLCMCKSYLSDLGSHPDRQSIEPVFLAPACSCGQSDVETELYIRLSERFT